MKAGQYLIDTGVLIALLDRSDLHHGWAIRTIDELHGTLATCESVLSEAWYLARRGGADPLRVLDLAEGLELNIQPTWGSLTSSFLRAYPRRASLADASLLALAESEKDSVVVTTDVEDFSVYRIRQNMVVPTLVPLP